ncbi:MAG: zinc ABC transporter substrate-binding protein [Pseudomonadota bacterium]
MTSRTKRWARRVAPLGAAAGALLLTAGSAAAEIKVAASIAPAHSLVARVMAGVGEPELVLPPGASPHGYAMKPSEARALEEADLVVWIGPALESWMERPIASLADDARVLTLADAPGVERLEVREGGVWAEHDHDHGHDHGEEAHGDHDHGAEEAAHDDHDHDHNHAAEKAAHDDHDHDHDHAAEKAAHDDHDHDHDHAAEEAAHDDHDHDHAGGFDPHLWLDPENAKAWTNAIASALAEVDPDNAARYRENAAEAVAELDALIAEIDAQVAPARGTPFVVFHDAYHYFEHRFEIEAAGSISVGDGAQPGPQRLREVQEAIRTREAACVFTEPQFSPKLAETAVEGSQAKIGVLDPIGASLTPGATLYPELLRGLARSLTGCLTAS